MKNYYRIPLLLILCNLGSLNSYAQTCSQDLGLKGPVKTISTRTYIYYETMDGYKSTERSSEVFPTTMSFPFNSPLCPTPSTIHFNIAGKITEIEYKDNSGTMPNSREYIYKNDTLSQIVRRTLYADGTSNSFVMLSLKYDETGRISDLYRLRDNREGGPIDHYKYTYIGDDVIISKIVNGDIKKIAQIQERLFINPLSKNIDFDIYSTHYFNDVLNNPISGTDDRPIYKSYENKPISCKYKYDKYGNWTECLYYYHLTDEPIRNIKRELRYYIIVEKMQYKKDNN